MVIYESNRLAKLLLEIKALDRAEEFINRAGVAAERDPKATGESAQQTAYSLAEAYDNMSARAALQRARR